MIDRYINRTVYKNSQDLYEELLRERNVKFINQYSTPKFTYPDKNTINRLKITEHVWSTGDRFFKLASKYYGDPADWWVIAKFNNMPTESHVKLGDIVLIPQPLQEVIALMRG